MTTYNAKDLIEQAQMLADLQNSDFISWKENMMFLDNAWSDLYQQIINHGDKSFLKTFSFEGERCELPRDFYQLFYVCYSDGLNERPINRKAKTSLTNNGPYYDMEGDDIVVFNKIGCGRKIVVYYFPIRDSITYASDDQKLDGIPETDDTPGTVVDVCDRKVLWYAEDEVYYVRDILTGKDEPLVDEEEEAAGFMITEEDVISGGVAFKFNNRCYRTRYENGVLELRKYNGKLIHSVNVSSDPHFPSGRINAFDGKFGLYYVENENLIRFDLETGEKETIAEGLVSNKVYCFKDDVYWETEDGVIVNGELLIPTTEYSEWHGVMKEDEKTGYGILFDNFVLKSIYENTQLLFPNNVYYNYLAYKLAVYYKIKQGADPSGVSSAAVSALNTFYNTILKDTNEYVRIANVYAR